MKELNIDNRVPTNVFVRLFFMIIMLALFTVVRWMTWLVVLFQFLSHLLTGSVTQRGVRWGQALSDWIHQMMLFMTYKSERMPFPFHTLWPEKD